MNKTFISASEQNKRLSRGVSIGNALEAPKEGDWGLTIKDEDFAKIREKGFSSVRIPIRWSAHSLNNSPYTIDEVFFNRIDKVINSALGSDLLIVINVHHFEELIKNPKNSREKLISLWEQISERYKDYSENLCFEIFNEPHFRLAAKKWNLLLNRAASIIRKSNPTRTILIGPAKWNNISGIKRLKLPENDKNIVLTFHYYSPFIFTHQGAEWVKFSKIFLGKKWTGTEKQIRKIERAFQYVSDWSKKYDIPVNMGEFGAYNKADLVSRVLWTNYVARFAEKYNFSWFYWEFGAGFGVYNAVSENWNSELLNSLIPETDQSHAAK